LSLIAATAVFCLTGCVTDSRPAQIQVGMSRDEVRACFGKPLRVEPAASGGEDWYYSFALWNTQVDGTVSRDDFGGRSTSGSFSISGERNAQECPVHLSGDGYVVDPVPDGKIVRN
jgi:hypothetical protein